MSQPLSYIREWRDRLVRGGWWHSFELPDGTVIQGVSDLAAQKMRLAQFPIPADLSGKRVLDAGTWDGWFAFQMESRGAEVLAIDCFDNPRFHEIRGRLGSRVEYRCMDVCDLCPEKVGRFDIVLFLGVLYHVKHPLLALERVCSVTRGMAAVESYVLPGFEDRKMLEFFEDDEFGGQVDNWFAPNTAALLAMCRTAGFARAELSNRHEYGAAVACFRSWGAEGLPGVTLQAAVNASDYGINFRSAKDEYVACRALAPDTRLTRDNVFPRVGGYGIRPAYVGPADPGRWHVNFKLPPGLEPGWHQVMLGCGNALAIAVDVDAALDRLEITGAADGLTWSSAEISSGFLALWVHGLPANADLANVKVWAGDAPQAVAFVGPPDAAGARQVNATVEAPPGEHAIAVSCGGVRSPAVHRNIRMEPPGTR